MILTPVSELKFYSSLLLSFAQWKVPTHESNSNANFSLSSAIAFGTDRLGGFRKEIFRYFDLFSYSRASNPVKHDKTSLT
jgi:hypothetical protein